MSLNRAYIEDIVAEVGAADAGVALVTDLGVIADGVTDSTATLKAALEHCATNNLRAVIRGDIAIASACQVDLPAGGNLEIDWRGTLIANGASAYTALTISRAATSTTTLTGGNTKYSTVLAVASASGIAAGDYISLTTTEKYTCRRLNGTTINARPLKGWVTRVYAVSGSNVTILDALPYDFDVTDYTVTVSVFKDAPRVTIKGFPKVRWTSSGSAETFGVTFTNIMGLRVENTDVSGATFDGIRLNGCYDWVIDGAKDIGGTTNISLNYGVDVRSSHNGTVKNMRSQTQRRPLTYSDMPGFGLRVQDCDLAGPDGSSLDTHVVGDIVAERCNLYNGVSMACGTHTFRDCNIYSSAYLATIRTDFRDFFEGVTFERCNFHLTDDSAGNRAVLRIQNMNRFGRLGPIKFKGCTLNGKTFTEVVIMSDHSNTTLALETTGSVSASSTSMTVSSAQNLYVGEYIYVAGLQGIRKITAISGTTVTLDVAADATVSDAAISRAPGSIAGVEIDGMVANAACTRILNVSGSGGATTKAFVRRGELSVSRYRSTTGGDLIASQSYASCLFHTFRMEDSGPKDMAWPGTPAFSGTAMSATYAARQYYDATLDVRNSWFTKSPIIGPTSAPGTLDISVTCDATNTSTTISNISDPAALQLRIGEPILIAGVTGRKVLVSVDISAATGVIDSASDATVSGAAVTKPEYGWARALFSRNHIMQRDQSIGNAIRYSDLLQLVGNVTYTRSNSGHSTAWTTTGTVTLKDRDNDDYPTP